MDKRLAEIVADLDKEFLDTQAALSTSLAGAKLFAKLQASECLLLQSYAHSVGGPLPQCSDDGGYFELGPFLYWFNNPPDEIQMLVRAIVRVLEFVEGEKLPPSAISPSLYRKIIDQARGTGIIAADGTIYSESKYEQLDTGWLVSLLFFLYYRKHPAEVHPFNPIARKIKLAGKEAGQVNIGIVGDWGTGRFGVDDGPAVAVISALESLHPDYVVHLGDVYYAGTQHSFGEEQRNFLSLWPPHRASGQSKQNTSFTLNSNHEMYDGANGYFKIALGSDGTPFSAQDRSSFFSLEYGPWVVIGLDSAYYSDPKHMFMVGSIGGAGGSQGSWVTDHYGHLKGRNVIVMTHHNAVATDGRSQVSPLWSEVCGALNGTPSYWLWGHVHNGIVYSNRLSSVEGASVRCIGHGAVPYGKAWGLEDAEGIEFYSHTPEGQGARVRNGFAVMTLLTNGTATETFYEVEDGSSKPIQVWPKPGQP